MPIHTVHPSSQASSSQTVIAQFCELSKTLADKVAIVFEDTQLTFGQLDDMASRLANAMLASGVKFGDTVGLCIERRPEAIASMLATFKIGAVFVPLDPEYPADRIRYMISDAAIKVIVTYDRSQNAIARTLDEAYSRSSSQRPHSTSAELKDESDSAAPQVTWIDCASPVLQTYSAQVAHRFPQPDDLAYIMYTSGSTGMPKGVQIEHRSLATYCDADREIYQLSSEDRTLQFSTLNFDIAIEEIFPPLLTGGVVVIRPQGRSLSHNELSSIVDQYQVTAIHIATAYWHEWVDLMVATKCTVPTSLRLVIATGEKVSVEHYHRWQGICQHDVLWCNAYGPTETTVTATVFIPDKQFNNTHMPIGKPLKGYQAYILDEQLRPLGIGETGHLFIGGDILARGYLNQPQKTAAAFVMVDLPHQGPTRIYRTGDLARWLPSGDIEYAGRVDHQIKVGSYRIEPGEIEATIATFPGVLESIVVCEERGSQKVLIAYVATSDRSFASGALRDYLKHKLPSYMVPGRVVCLDSLPKTMNGKIDRKQLPIPDSDDSAENDYPLNSAVEQRMRAIWKEVLCCDQIKLEDDFFAIGGSSLLVTRVVASIAIELGIELPVRDFFANPTLQAISCHVEQQLHRKQETSGAAPTPRRNDHLHERLPEIQANMIPSGDHHLFSVHYQPRQHRLNHAVLICNSIGHEQTRAYRNLQQLALQLAHCGFDVLRFDYRGTGNSSGSPVMPDAACFIEDVETAAREICHPNRRTKFSVIGLRMGALFAIKAQLPPIEHLVLWDPVFHGDSYVTLAEQFHKENLNNQSRFSYRVRATACPQIFGWQTTPDSLTSLRALRFDPRQWETGLQSATRTTMILSDGYALCEPGMESAAGCEHQDVQDQIGWHQVSYCERAFSSPGSYQAILQRLKEVAPASTSLTSPTIALPSYPVPTMGVCS